MVHMRAEITVSLCDGVRCCLYRTDPHESAENRRA